MNGPINETLVLDSNIIIDFLNRQTALPRGNMPDEPEYVVSVITEMEILSKPGISAGDERDARAFLSNLFIVPLHEEVKQEAIAIRRNASPRRIKLPDAIVAATAVVLGAKLATRDTDLIKTVWPGLQTVSVSHP